MTAFEPRNPDFEPRIRSSFARQSFMDFIGAELVRVDPGAVEIALPYRDELCQQHGFFHGGVVGTLADNVGGYASFSLMAAKDSVLTVEFKLNLMAPATGQRLLAKGSVMRPGRRLTVCRGDVFSVVDGAESLCATALATYITLEDTPDRPQQ